MTEHAGFTAIVLVEFHVAAPHQIMGRTFPRMLAMIQTGVDIQGVIILVIKRQAMKKLDVFGWNAFRHQLARLIKVRFLLYSQRLSGVLLKSSFAAGGWSHPDRRRLVEKIQQHL